MPRPSKKTIRDRLNEVAGALLDEAKGEETSAKLAIFREVVRWEQIRNKIGDLDDSNTPGKPGSAFGAYRSQIEASGSGGSTPGRAAPDDPDDEDE